MALTVTNALALTGSSTGFGTGAFTTAAFTPGSGKRLVVRAFSMSNIDDSLAGADLTITDSMGPLTWTPIVGSPSSDSIGWSYAGRAWISSATTGAGSMTITLDAGAFDIYRYGIIVDVVEGEDVSPVGGIATGNDADGDGAASITLNATPASTSYIFAGMIRADSGTSSAVTAGTGWTAEGTINSDSWLAFHAQRRTGITSTSVGWDDLAAGGSPAGALMFAFEIKEAGGGGDATVNGQTLTATASLIAGTAASDGATVNGQTLTATASLVRGVVESYVPQDLFIFGDTSSLQSSMGGAKLFGGFVASGSADATVNGQTLTATASLITGTASGGATVNGQTLTATASLVPGAVTATSIAAGQTLTATASLIAGSASGGGSATVAGQTLTATASLTTGTASADATVSGTTFTSFASLLAATASADASVPTQILVATASFVPGAASGVANATVNGQTLTATASLLAGGASGPSVGGGWRARVLALRIGISL